MASFPGGSAVKSGHYIHGKSFEFATVEKDGGTLPGGPEASWVRIPVWLVVAAAPALGGLFVVTFPLIGFGVTAYALVRKVARLAGAGATELAATLATRAVPGEAHLTGDAAARPEVKEPEATAPAAPPAKDEPPARGC
jgi:hypothetical protein